MREYLQKNHLFEEKHAFCFQASLNMSRGGRREKPLAALKAFKDIWKLVATAEKQAKNRP